jgi:hypothetical protein
MNAPDVLSGGIMKRESLLSIRPSPGIKMLVAGGLPGVVLEARERSCMPEKMEAPTVDGANTVGPTALNEHLEADAAPSLRWIHKINNSEALRAVHNALIANCPK